MEKLYCTIFIIDVSQNPEEVETITSRINQLIEDHGGTIKKHNPWGKKRLAYPINKRTSGFYVEIEFVAQSRLNIPQTIEKEFRLNDRVLRYLTYEVTKEELRQRERNMKTVARREEREAKEAAAAKAETEKKEAAKKSNDAAPKVAEAPATEPAEAAETPAETATSEEPEAK